MKIDALLDSNVLIAMLVATHDHHAPSLALLAEDPAGRFAVAAHSYAESYNALTRSGERGPFRFTPAEAWAAIESVRAVTNLIGLTASQSFDTIRSYAESGGIGPRLYDRLIGETAVVYGIGTIVTWNTSHMRSLFPRLAVVTPADAIANGIRTN